MGTLETTKFIPLLIDRQCTPIPVPSTVTSIIVRGGTKGRARHLGDKGGDLVLDADADMNDLIEATGNQPGRFLTFARDTEGRVLPQTGYVTVTPEHLGMNLDSDSYDTATIPAGMALEHSFAVTNRVLSLFESNALVQQQSLQTLASCVVDMQRGGVDMIREHSTTLRVANGMERIERDEPEVDVEELARRLDETIKRASKKKSFADWLPFIKMGADVVKGMAASMRSQPAQPANPASKPTAEKPAPPPREAAPAPSEPVCEDDDDDDEYFEEETSFEDVTEPDVEASEAVVCESAPLWYSTAPESVRREPVTPMILFESAIVPVVDEAPARESSTQSAKDALSATEGSSAIETDKSERPIKSTRPERVEHAQNEPERPNLNESPQNTEDHFRPPLLE